MKGRISNVLLSVVIAAVLPAARLCGGIVVKGELTREKSALPGQIYEGVITLSNDDAALTDVKIFQTDYLFNCRGQTFYNEPGQQDRSNAAWIEFSPKRLTVAPGGEASVTYKVHVPDRQSLDGTYWSIIMVEPVSASSLENPLQEQTVGINTVVRYGIQIVTQIEKSGEPVLNFLDVKLLESETGPYLQVDLENGGTRWAKPLVWLELVNSSGRKMDRYESGSMRVYPGTSVRHKIDVSGIPFDTYQALLIADGGENAMIGKQLTLNITRKE